MSKFWFGVIIGTIAGDKLLKILFEILGLKSTTLIPAIQEIVSKILNTIH